ncbi:hypothetical protein PSZ80_24100, partial [Shigella sonnei]|nr:hypothetical protein [Shigella sonnei]
HPECLWVNGIPDGVSAALLPVTVTLDIIAAVQ